MSRNNTAKSLSNTEDHVAIAKKFNRYFTSVGRLTALKAKHLIQEQQLDVTEVVTQQVLMTSYDYSDCFNFKVLLIRNCHIRDFCDIIKIERYFQTLCTFFGPMHSVKYIFNHSKLTG